MEENVFVCMLFEMIKSQALSIEDCRDWDFLRRKMIQEKGNMKTTQHETKEVVSTPEPKVRIQNLDDFDINYLSETEK